MKPSSFGVLLGVVGALRGGARALTPRVPTRLLARRAVVDKATPSRILEGRYALNDRPNGCPGLGAVLPNVDLTTDFSEADLQVLCQASHEAGGILVFPNQRGLTTAGLVEFARQLGDIEPHAVAESTVPDCPEILEIIREPNAQVVFGENWHSDNSFMDRTCSFSILRATGVMPERGLADTMFSSVEAAYDALSPAFQDWLCSLRAYHSAEKAYGVSIGKDSNSRAAMEATGKMRLNQDADILRRDYLHPVVTVHPDTGRKGLFVSPTFTRHIDGLHADESEALLQFLYAHIAKPEFCTRVSWSKHQVTMWDNRSLSHKGLADPSPDRRIVHRVSLRGTRPLGVGYLARLTEGTYKAVSEHGY